MIPLDCHTTPTAISASTPGSEASRSAIVMRPPSPAHALHTTNHTDVHLDESMDIDGSADNQQQADNLYLSESEDDFIDAESDADSLISSLESDVVGDSSRSSIGQNNTPSAQNRLPDQSRDGILAELSSESTSERQALHDIPAARFNLSDDENGPLPTFPSTEGATFPDSLSSYVEVAPDEKVSLDLVHRIPGLYRILDLISERGSGGLVDKVIIDQASTGRFINEISPGAYKNLTKVEFTSLDKISVKPMGIYGSKSEIVRFLCGLGALDDETARLLMISQADADSGASPDLRPGLYAFVSQGNDTRDRKLLVIFWPEETTWDDNCISSVRRNRVTFMRYLTKIADQIIALVAEEHGRTLVWDDPNDVDNDTETFDGLDSDTDRLFAFEVAKAREQEENIAISEGMKIKSALIEKKTISDEVALSKHQPETYLVAGDTRQALLTWEFVPGCEARRKLDKVFENKIQLKAAIKDGRCIFRLSENISNTALSILIHNGLDERYSQAVREFKSREKENEERIKCERKLKSDEIPQRVTETKPMLKDALEDHFVKKALSKHPKLNEAVLRGKKHAESSAKDERDLSQNYLEHIFTLHPTLREKLNCSAPRDGPTPAGTKVVGDVRKAMKKVLICDHLFENNKLSESEQEIVWRWVETGVETGNLKDDEGSTKVDGSGVLSNIVRGIKQLGQEIFRPFRKSTTDFDSPIKEALGAAQGIKFADFCNSVDDILKKWPVLKPGVDNFYGVTSMQYAEQIANKVFLVSQQLIGGQIKECLGALDLEISTIRAKEQRRSRSQLLADLENASSTEGVGAQTIILEELEQIVPPYPFPNYGRNEQYHARGLIVTKSEPRMTYTIHPLELTEEDKQSIRMVPSFVPKPEISKRRSFSFNLRVGSTIRLLRLLPNDRCMIVIEEHRDLFVYNDTERNLNAAIAERHHVKQIKREKSGEDISVTYDEGKRMLAVCGVEPQKPLIQMYCFVFDERYESLTAQGGAINLTDWYSQEIPKITDIHIVSSSDELALVEDSGKVRVFSTVTQQFRPAHLQLPIRPLTTFSTPDGSCFGAIYSWDNGLILKMYHWASLSSDEGFAFKIDESFSARPVISALDERSNVHLFTLDFSNASCLSVRINITRPVTEFQFREKNSQGTSGSEELRTIHNSLIDCHSEVWTRFPVLPAVQRQTIVSRDRRKCRSIRFSTLSQTQFPFEAYFKDIVQKFEKSTKKPTGSLLSDIAILTCDGPAGLDIEDAYNDCSVYQAGEWIVDIFCLIPIHIAIARDNRFVPLKDGVWAPELEKSLLGADVGRVADSLSFGWYESIFQSYMSTKKVKVVSSMGEQSVGKSFALNHLADTSFAGSAMRTTEGVWMAVTPTETDLIVALDFEGVHSVERSAQEDTLLVLFNAAISNLVLFRNNFALSRDITNLFQSFQSSSSILDPETNRSLFQSTLVIIIKDVVDSDRIEIAKEFKLKLHKIVQEEQELNFITRLYRGHLSIIPWPVIESRQFYTLFATLKKHLDNQASTHDGGGSFLHKLKMLMAKLKTNDWGSLSQNMGSHRAQQLLSLLPYALRFGATEIEPDVEPLKNFETNHEIENEDTDAIFSLSSPEKQSADQKAVILKLMDSWPGSQDRNHRPDCEWIEQLCLHLQAVVDKRVMHVQAWIDSNLSQFDSSNAAIEELRRSLEARIVEIKRSVQLCKARCDNCLLLCIDTKFHEGAHDCSTNHACPRLCQFTSDHESSPDPCYLAAGHEGVHMCDPSAHVCGQRCNLSERKGCQGTCTKVAEHLEVEHLCSARRHSCGKPCELRNVEESSGKMYSCQGTCSAAWDDEHDIHLCDATSCPLTCLLCKRLCASSNHSHALEANAVHLCGQEHRCKEECGSKGVCEIGTVPQSIEATFDGAHDRFQYTKYSQTTKRLPCAIAIAPGRISHDGEHTHSESAKTFHYCDVRCANCDYVCTLPHGHPQPEHSTNHGSMYRTRWVIDGPDGNSLELDGHKFGSNDDGAPMLCNLICSSMGRHTHIDYCRSVDPEACTAPEIDHIKVRIDPNPERPKDWISHTLFWRRLGFKDPYSREEQTTFSKCDAMCSGEEHKATANNAAQPSYCTLPIFHPPAVLGQGQAGGHVSDDGHTFLCKNPAVLTQAFHVIFVIDRSSSMNGKDRRPLADYQASDRIRRTANNRLGAVYSALHSFWSARASAINQAGIQARRDAYSAILFNGSPKEIFTNDFQSSPNDLLEKLLRYPSSGGTNFTAALSLTEQVMERHWSTERSPVVIFLSDGECPVGDNVVYSLCRKAVSRGRALSFHAVSFGPDGSSTWLRRMVQIAKEVQDRAPRDPLLLANAAIESSYNVALDSVNLAETFLGLAESLRKTRGGLIR